MTGGAHRLKGPPDYPRAQCDLLRMGGAARPPIFPGLRGGDDSDDSDDTTCNTLMFPPSRKRPVPTPASASPRRPRAARLWNPTNSTPRLPKAAPVRKRRPSTPPLPAVLLSHPAITDTSTVDPVRTADGDYPLLTLSEQRQTKHTAPSRPSFQIEQYGAGERRISLPRSVRHSYDGKRSANATPTPTEPEFTWAYRNSIHEQGPPSRPLDKGKGKEIATTTMAHEHENAAAARFSVDLERGPETEGHPRPSNVSAGDGIGSPMSSNSSDSSIMGEDVQGGDATQEWGPQHPCYPHLNPHVPASSPEYAATRIIRVRRDYMVGGDLAPAFSDTYPDILDPVGLSEQEFRRIISKLNTDLVSIHDPYGWRNILDATLGLLTGWVWDDLGFTGIKARLAGLEGWIERWNQEMEKTLGADDGMAPRIIPLRKTGYMTLDIQIPDPEIAPAPSTPRDGAGSGFQEVEVS
ncbi:uncharacterized protein DNG_01413 [Cephalotrichum gorgonifer]|uniref:Ras modification protein ERF4 n=1 Tax=Cephalotrichum gorgonifer TaxID=2041049 RepID=A0AAE8MRU5_9PEZI|nr:uncharacterized protein DNG_01413 [Cephalotrichum gorgonifer]